MLFMQNRNLQKIWMFFIEADPANAEKILAVLHDFGFKSLDLTIEDFIEPEQVIQFG